MEALFIFLFAILGLAVGSFLNVCIDRLPRNESLISPRSHCEACRHPLAARDLVPLFSYLALGARCRYCRARIPRRVPAVELTTAVVFPLLFWHYGFSAELGVMAFYACLFTVIFLIDLEQGLILNKVTYPAMAVILTVSAFLPQRWLTQWLVSGVANVALAGGIAFVIFFVLAIVSRGGMGWGDVKLAALIGFATGFPLVLISIFIAALLGGTTALALLIAKRKTPREAVPFGPFLASAAMITLLWGKNILAWYLALPG